MITQEKNILSDNRAFSILDRYSASGSQPIGTLLRKMVENNQNAEMIIPVLGMQGMGKSTIINAILGENILPNDADETTCVPVEVKYGEKEHAEVFFLEKNAKEVVYTREELNFYVDNVENPGNEKGVSHIVLYRKNVLLQSGLVIVDLPGVGSLTARNAETTHRYIRNLCTAIFVIPTTPTLRRQELMFIKTVWTQFPKAIFVQNLWDESPRELDESIEYNTLLLKKVAHEINAQFDEKIVVVQAYDALAGAIQKDRKLVESSNIEELIHKIEVFSANWTSSLNAGLEKRMRTALMTAMQDIEEKIDQIGMTREERKKEAQKKLEEYRENSRRLYQKISDVEVFLMDSETAVRKKARESAEQCATKIRTEINRIIDKGVTDGEKLNSAFKHIQEDATATAFEGMFDEFMKIKYELENRLFNLENTIMLENDMYASSAEFQKDKAFKFEKSFDAIGGIGGGIGGFLAGGAIAKIGVLGALAGPVGVIAGIAIGVAGAAIGAFAKKKVKQSRAAATKSEISSVIDDMEQKVYRTMVNEFGSVTKSISDVLHALKTERREEERRLKAEIDLVQVPDDEKSLEKQLRDDLAHIKSIL